jgi:hypothetical protein
MPGRQGVPKEGFSQANPAKRVVAVLCLSPLAAKNQNISPIFRITWLDFQNKDAQSKCLCPL